MIYRGAKEEADADLRYRVSTHVQEIKSLQSCVRELEDQNRRHVSRSEFAEAKVIHLENQLSQLNLKLIQKEVFYIYIYIYIIQRIT